ncbi:unnamed protein product, partial [Prorocentrum cordatum]
PPGLKQHERGRGQHAEEGADGSVTDSAVFRLTPSRRERHSIPLGAPSDPRLGQRSEGAHLGALGLWSAAAGFAAQAWADRAARRRGGAAPGRGRAAASLPSPAPAGRREGEAEDPDGLTRRAEGLARLAPPGLPPGLDARGLGLHPGGIRGVALRQRRGCYDGEASRPRPALGRSPPRSGILADHLPGPAAGAEGLEPATTRVLAPSAALAGGGRCGPRAARPQHGHGSAWDHDNVRNLHAPLRAAGAPDRPRRAAHPGRGGGRPLADLIRAQEALVPSKTNAFDISVPLDFGRQCWLARCVEVAVRRRGTGSSLLGLVCADFAAAFKTVLKGVGASVLQGTLYSLRHGGASHDRSMGARSLAAVQQRGGWRAFQSATRYEKHGRLGLRLQKLGPARLALLRQRSAGIELAFERYFGLR